MTKKPIMTISYIGKDKYIALNKYSILALGEPRHICMLIRSDKQAIAFVPCKEKHVMSFKVHENYSDSKNLEFKIWSKGFVEQLVRVNNLETEKSHYIEGAYDEAKNIIEFPINVA